MIVALTAARLFAHLILLAYENRTMSPTSAVVADVEISRIDGHNDVCFAQGPRPSLIVSRVEKNVARVCPSSAVVVRGSAVNAILWKTRITRMRLFGSCQHHSSAFKTTWVMGQRMWSTAETQNTFAIWENNIPDCSSPLQEGDNLKGSVHCRPRKLLFSCVLCQWGKISLCPFLGAILADSRPRSCRETRVCLVQKERQCMPVSRWKEQIVQTYLRVPGSNYECILEVNIRMLTDVRICKCEVRNVRWVRWGGRTVVPSKCGIWAYAPHETSSLSVPMEDRVTCRWRTSFPVLGMDTSSGSAVIRLFCLNVIVYITQQGLLNTRFTWGLAAIIPPVLTSNTKAGQKIRVASQQMLPWAYCYMLWPDI